MADQLPARSEPGRLRGLYVITDAELLPGERLVEGVDDALRGGARLVQYRDKSTDHARRLAEAGALARLCERRGALLIVNDDVELATAVQAHGVHLGKDDVDLEEARARLGPRAVIGVSCYNQLARAREMAARGADYVAFGRFYPSAAKPEAVHAEPALLTAAAAELAAPVVAIGGITADNAPPLIEAGADMVAVIHGVFGASDIEAAARALTSLFETR